MISSTSNIKVKNIINLKKSAKARKKENCFLVEGPRMFFEIPRDRVMECYLTEEFAGKYDKELRGWNYELISENVCRHLSDTKTPQGCHRGSHEEKNLTLENSSIKKRIHAFFS